MGARPGLRVSATWRAFSLDFLRLLPLNPPATPSAAKVGPLPVTFPRLAPGGLGRGWWSLVLSLPKQELQGWAVS